jgi:hypothetical protein
MTVALDQQPATYDGDFCAWLEQQAALLRAGRFDRLDIENIAEELEGLSRSDKRALGSHLKIAILHLLKWQRQPDRRGSSWEISIRNARTAALDLIADSPSLRPLLPDMVRDAYARAVSEVAMEGDTPETAFPAECPYSLDQILDYGFYPVKREHV